MGTGLVWFLTFTLSVTQLEVVREQDWTVNAGHLASSPAKQRNPLPLPTPHGWQNATIYKLGGGRGLGGEEEWGEGK